MSAPFRKILIANRGEIAVRVMRTCERLGMATVAVYSDADKNSLHVRSADEAYHIGPAAPSESYLVIDKLIQAARQSGAEAIHPGYGFLSENPRFADACQEAGVVFIGPDSKSMRQMGDKVSARKVAREAGAPVVPGLEGVETDIATFVKIADEVGYPVLIKASSGGGGKGMRLVQQASELEGAIESAAREAEKAFGDGSIYLEKYIQRPRHIEFQIFGDTFGNVTHLFERECSIQRRHQKIIEETPSPALNDELRTQMGEAAVNIAGLAKYCNAGTVEFLLDESGAFYFLEMNTRLQVEHPVTEMTTGLDLVEEQIRIAAGEKLSEKLLTARQTGHAIECRIYAEDAANKFFPSSGVLLRYVEPKGEGIRVDSGVSQNDRVGIEYDPILAKLVVCGRNRNEARERMIEALQSYSILGIKTCVGYLAKILETDEFQRGDVYTDFVDTVMRDYGGPDESECTRALAIAGLALELGAHQHLSGVLDDEDEAFGSPWMSLKNWRLGQTV